MTCFHLIWKLAVDVNHNQQPEMNINTLAHITIEINKPFSPNKNNKQPNGIAVNVAILVVPANDFWFGLWEGV